jgi:hypothetical protein
MTVSKAVQIIPVVPVHGDVQTIPEAASLPLLLIKHDMIIVCCTAKVVVLVKTLPRQIILYVSLNILFQFMLLRCCSVALYWTQEHVYAYDRNHILNVETIFWNLKPSLKYLFTKLLNKFGRICAYVCRLWCYRLCCWPSNSVINSLVFYKLINSYLIWLIGIWINRNCLSRKQDHMLTVIWLIVVF